MILGDLGADVIKIENPAAGGDELRKSPPTYPGGESHYFISVNRNKRSLAIDIKSPEGRARVIELARSCDIVLENFRPGVAERLGLGPRDIAGVNPAAVYASISGYPADSDDASLPCYDIVALAAAGLVHVGADPDSTPVRPGVPMADIATGMYAAAAMLAALYRTRNTGQGQIVRLNMVDCSVALTAASREHPGATRTDNHNPAPFPFTLVETQTGFVVVPSTESELQNRLDYDELRATAAARPSRSVVEDLGRCGVQAFAVRSVREALEAAAVGGRGVGVIKHPTAGAIHTVLSAFRLSADGSTWNRGPMRPPPLLDEHRGQGWTSAERRPLHSDLTADGFAPNADIDRRSPLTGMAVAADTRTLAGTYATRLLAALGADVLPSSPLATGISADAGQKSTASKAFALLLHDSPRPTLCEGLSAGVRCRIVSTTDCDADSSDWVSDLGQQAASGLMSLTGSPDGPPLPVAAPVTEIATGILASAVGIAACLARGTAEFVEIDVSDVALTLLGNVAQLVLLTGEPPHRVGTKHHHRAAYGVFRTANGYLALAALTDRMFADLRAVLGESPLLDDPRVASVGGRSELIDEVNEEVQRKLSRRTTAEWVTDLRSAGVPCSELQSASEVLRLRHSDVKRTPRTLDAPFDIRPLSSEVRSDSSLTRTGTASV